MKIKGWKKCFPAHILERGENYYFEDAVENLTFDGSTAEATVHGSEDYSVEIMFDGSSVADMYCDCPYADDGNYCKHMAAVLYALEDEPAPRAPLAMRQLSEIIERLPEAQLRSFLLQLARENEAIENRIRLLDPGSSREAATLMEADIQRILRSAADRHGYIDYSKAFDAMCELCTYLEEYIPLLIGRGEYSTAFYTVCEAFGEAVTVEMDDSDGGLTMLFETCRGCWECILSSAELYERRDMYHWFETHMGEFFIDYAEDVIEDIMLCSFDEPEFLEKSLRYTEKMLKNAKSYDVPGYVEYAFELMQKLGLPNEQIEELRLRYRYLPFIRKRETEQAISEKDYEKAVMLLRESMEIDIDSPGLCREYAEKIIEIYEFTGQKEELAQELLRYISDFRQTDLAYIRKYKSLISSEKWENTLNGLLTMPTVDSLRMQIFAEEKRYRELFDELKQTESLLLFCTYDDILRKQFPEEALSYFRNLLEKAMDEASSRKQYKDVLSYLGRLREYPNGTEQILLLSQVWRLRYSRRKAMLDELNIVLSRGRPE